MGYSDFLACAGGLSSSGKPSACQRGNPPSRMLDLSCPNALNMKSARGDENTPCVSYLRCGLARCAGDGRIVQTYKITCEEGSIPNASATWIRKWGCAQCVELSIPHASANCRSLGIICLRPSSWGEATSSRSKNCAPGMRFS